MAKSFASLIVSQLKALYGKVTDILAAVIILFIIQAILIMAAMEFH